MNQVKLVIVALLDQWAQPACQAKTVKTAVSGLRVNKVNQVHQVHRELEVSQVLQVFQVLKVTEVIQEKTVKPDYLVLQETKVNAVAVVKLA